MAVRKQSGKGFDSVYKKILGGAKAYRMDWMNKTTKEVKKSLSFNGTKLIFSDGKDLTVMSANDLLAKDWMILK